MAESPSVLTALIASGQYVDVVRHLMDRGLIADPVDIQTLAAEISAAHRRVKNGPRRPPGPTDEHLVLEELVARGLLKREVQI